MCMLNLNPTTNKIFKINECSIISDAIIHSAGSKKPTKKLNTFYP